MQFSPVTVMNPLSVESIQNQPLTISGGLLLSEKFKKFQN